MYTARERLAELLESEAHALVGKAIAAREVAHHHDRNAVGVDDFAAENRVYAEVQRGLERALRAAAGLLQEWGRTDA